MRCAARRDRRSPALLWRDHVPHRADARLRLAFRFADLSMALASEDLQSAAQPARVKLYLLGAPRLQAGEDAALPLEQRVAALLALLAIDGPMPRARAAGLLWPDADDRSARNNLRQRLFRLRRAARCDVVQADDMLALAGNVTHDLGDLAARLRADADAAVGELLGSVRYDEPGPLADWVDIAREQWAVARRNALADITAELEGAGRLAPALRYAERLVLDAPLMEHAHRRLMRLHYLRGDRGAALGAYERCRLVLQQELGAEPGAETLELARIIGDSIVPTHAQPVRSMTVLRPPRLIGREREWRQLAQAWQQHHVALLLGEPGIGKSRFATDWVAAWSGATLSGARPGDERVPYALLARLLRALVERWGAPTVPWVATELARLLPELGATSSGKAQPLKLRQAMAVALESMARAGLNALVVDDLQFADEPSIAALLWLSAQDAGRALDWLFLTRAAEMPAALREWKQRAEAVGITDIELPPLDEAGVRELLASLALPGVDAAQWAPVMARHTGGSPLFILETLLALLASGTPLSAGGGQLPTPARIGELIERRLRQLTPSALKLARVAALAGQDFSVELAARVLDLHALDIVDAWRELEAAQIIRDNAFAHDLQQAAALRSVPQAIARSLHRDIAAWLVAHGGEPAAVANHHFEAGQWVEAGTQFRKAAESARAAGEHAAAMALYERAERSFDNAGQRTPRLDAMRMRAASLQFLKRFDEYAALGREISTLAVTPQERLWALDALAKSRFEQHADEESIRLLREARLLAQEVDDPVVEVSLAEWEALGLSFLGRHAEAMAVGRSLAEYIAAHPDDELAALRKRQYAYLLEMDNQFDAAIDLLRDADEHARRHGELGLLGEIQVIRGACLFNIGRVDAAIDEYHAARRLLLESMAGRQGWTTYDLALGRYLVEAGRYAEALTLLESSRELYGDSGGWFGEQAAVNLAQCWIALGQFARASRLLGERAPQDPMAHIGWLFARARMARMNGQSALPLLDDVEARAAGSPRVERVLWQAAVERAMELDGDAAAALAAEVIERSLAKNTASAFVPAMAVHVDALRRAGRHADAVNAARRLCRALDGGPAVVGIYEPLLWSHLRDAFAAGGEAAEAKAALQRAVAWIRETAASKVPEANRSSFLERNPVNRALLAAVTRER